MGQIFYSFILFMLCACSDSDQSKVQNTTPQAQVQTAQEITKHPKPLKDSIFSDFIDRSKNSKTTELMWSFHRGGPKPVDESIEGDTTTPPKKIYRGPLLFHLNDRKQILQFIDSLPPLRKHLGSSSGITADLGSHNIVFICDKDTIVEFSWLRNWNHLSINEHFYIMDFEKLDSFFKNVRTIFSTKNSH
jgi:hypothetical protein